MTRKTHALALLALAAIAALVIAGCGGGGGDSTSSGSAYGGKGGSAGETASEGGSKTGAYAAPTAAPNPEEGATFVSLGNTGDLGMVLVDSKGFTLYDFHKDKGGEPTCYGACAKFWPPLLTEGEPHPSNGAQANLLGTVERKDGTTQVTYKGWPLYTYAGDKKPGEATGNDISAFGAQWYALMGNGEEPEDG